VLLPLIYGLVTVIAHYIDEQWKLESKVLLTRELKERHTGENITEALCAVINEWKIDENCINAIVHDNASNMNVTIEKLGWCDVHCFAHTLQFAINSGLDISGVINRLASIARKLVSHFKHSPLAMIALKEKQKQLSVPEHHLIQDVAIRWNFMFEKLLEQRWVIYAVLHDDQWTQGQCKHLYLKRRAVEANRATGHCPQSSSNCHFCIVRSRVCFCITCIPSNSWFFKQTPCF